MISKIFLKRLGWTAALDVGLMTLMILIILMILMVITFAWLSLLLLIASSASAEELVWEQTNGPYGGTISALLATPDGMLYAGTWNGGIFRSEDRGNSWTAVNKGLPKNYIDGSYERVFLLAIMRTTLFAGTGQGLYRSDDKGSNWIRTEVGRSQTGIYSVHSFAIIGKTIFVGAGNGLYRSEDNGNTWTLIGLKDFWLPSLAVIGTTLFAGTSGSLYRSEDNGNTWTTVNMGLTNPFVKSLAVMDAMIFAGVGIIKDRGIYRSDDGGNNWIRTGLQDFGINSFAVLGATIYVGTDGGGIFRSEDRGNTWIPVNTGLTNPMVNSLAVMDTTLFAGTSGGVFRSEDGGNSWIPINTSLTNSWVNSFAVMGKMLFAGTRSGVFRSEDRGNSWTAANTGLTNIDVQSLAISETTLYAGTRGGGIFRSEDRGNSWTEANIGLTNLMVTSLAVIDTTLFAGTEDSGVFRSEDRGNNWTPVNTGLITPMVKSLAIMNTTLFAGTEGTLKDGVFLEGGVFRSEGKGNSWTQVNTGLPWNQITGSIVGKYIIIESLAVTGAIIFAGTNQGVYRSEDKGNTWTSAGMGFLWNAWVNLLTVSGTTIYASYLGGYIVRLEDGGNNWTIIKPRRDKSGEITPDVGPLAVIGTTLFAGTKGSGVLRAPLVDETAVGVDQKGKLPTYWGKIKTALLQNYPNPFNPETWIPYQRAEDAIVRIRIYNAQGELVRQLELGQKPAGAYLTRETAAYWDGKNELGESVGSGLYFYRLDAGDFTAIRRMILVK